MFKNTNPVAVAFGVVAVCSMLAIATLSPVSASSKYEASTVYLPDQIANQGTAVEALPDAFGDHGLSMSFPEEDPASLTDAAPMIYS